MFGSNSESETEETSSREQSHPGEELVKVRNLKCPHGHAFTCADPFLHIAHHNLPTTAALNINFLLGATVKHKTPQTPRVDATGALEIFSHINLSSAKRHQY